MADEIQIATSLSVNVNGTQISGSTSKSITMAGTLKSGTTQAVGTTTEALDFGDISNIGYVYLKNNDATNFVMVGITSPVSSSNAMITLLAGESAAFPTRLETIYAIADTASCNVEVIATSL